LDVGTFLYVNPLHEHEGAGMVNLPKGLARSGAIGIMEKLRSISSGRVLDVATGDGGFIDTLMKTLKDYDSFVGIDYSEKEVESGKKRFKDQPVRIMKMNAESLEFENNSFDTVCISHSLHHLDSIDKVLTEMKRVLKLDGNFIIQEMYCDGEQTEAQRTDILIHHWDAEIDSLLGVTHNNTLTKQKIKDVVNRLGLKEVEVFESTHYVKCLFCGEKFECENPKNEKIVNQAIKEIDDNLRRLEEHPDLKMRTRLKEEGERLKDRLRKFGIANGSVLFIVGKK